MYGCAKSHLKLRDEAPELLTKLRDTPMLLTKQGEGYFPVPLTLAGRDVWAGCTKKAVH